MEVCSHVYQNFSDAYLQITKFSYPMYSTACKKALLKIVIVKMHLTPWQTVQMFE